MGTDEYSAVKENIDIKVNDDIRAVFTDQSESFGTKTDSDLNIYDRLGGAVLKNYGESATEGLSYAGSIITWNGAWANLGITTPGQYYYELTYEDSGLANPTIISRYGYITIE